MDKIATELNGLTADIRNKFQEQDAYLMKLERKMAVASRPELASSNEGHTLHRTALEDYVRSGDDDGLRHLPAESKAMNSQVAGDGGYLVDPETTDTIRTVLEASGSLRAIASVVNIDAAAFDVLVDHGTFGTGWATDSDASTESDSGTLDRISIALHELSAMPKVSQRLLDDSAFEIETWLAERIAGSFVKSEASAFISGDGANKPKGILSYPQVGNDTWEWGKVGTVSSGELGSIGDGETLIDLIYALGAEYRGNAHFVMNSRTAGSIRKLRDADGRFLWTDGMASAEPARLLGYPVVIAEDMPDIGDNTTPIAFGSFSVGYTIAERPDLRILRDPFSAKPHVLFYATKRVGGGITDFGAIKLLSCSAA